jgi:excisionase family DNA binding protein
MRHDLQFALPFAEKDEVSVTRVCKILGVTRLMVVALCEAKEIKGTRRHPTGNHFISYKSLIEYTDRLRVRYAIEDTRPKRDGIFGRYRDDEILPFSLAHDTMTVPEVAELLRYSQQKVRILCEEGVITSYKLLPDGFWRISKKSVAALFEQMYKQLAG